LLRLTALPLHESPQVEAKSLLMSQWFSPQNSSSSSNLKTAKTLGPDYTAIAFYYRRQW
jgi:hypothetical protein